MEPRALNECLEGHLKRHTNAVVSQSLPFLASDFLFLFRAERRFGI